MRYVTELMDKVFSDSTPREYLDAVSKCFADATAANGKVVTVKTPQGDLQGVLKDDGTVEITDGNNGEVTTATKDSNGDVKLSGNPPADGGQTPQTSQVPQDQKKAPQAPDPNQGQTKANCYSATLPDAFVKKPEYPEKGLEPTTEQNRPTEPDSIEVSVEEAITDPDKAGYGKNYSLVFSGFSSPEMAEQAYSEITEMYSNLEDYDEVFSDLEDNCLTFSEEEIAAIAEQSNAVKELQERVEGVKDEDPAKCAELCADLKTMSENCKAYSILAQNMGYEMGDVIEAMTAFSDYADEVSTYAYSNMDVNEYFSNFDEDQLNDYFSNLGEVESQVLYSALEDDENTYTFSEIDEAIDKVYSEMALEQSVNEYFSDATEDDVNEFFSDLTEDESNAVFSVLSENEDATFSDVNAAIKLANTPLVELFSNASEDDIAMFSENVGEDLADLAFSLAEYDEDATYSDFVNLAEEVTSFSDEDAENIVENTEELEKAGKVLEDTEDPELAKKVKVLCASTAAAIPMACTDETLLYCKATCDEISELADNVLYSHGINEETFDEIDTDGDGEISKEEWEAAGGTPEAFKAMDTNGDGIIEREEFEKVDKNHDGILSKEELADIIDEHSDNVMDKVHCESDVEDAMYSEMDDLDLENSLYSDPNFETDETRVFAKVNGEEGYSTINSCLTSVIN